MAHRGRLNVLAHVLNKPYAQILAEFKDPARDQDLHGATGMTWLDRRRQVPPGRPPRARGRRAGPSSSSSMPPNPSHLEASTRWSRAWRAPPAPRVDQPGRARASTTRSPLPILIHGDAAFPGQGVVAETLNLSRLPRLRHRRHDPHHRQQPARLHHRAPTTSRSTLYASDLAKGFKIPIVHVNADDPEACIEAARLAFAYRAPLPQGLPDRPGRLPPLRPQRGRRAGLHPAAAVRADRRPPDRARAAGRAPWSSAA